MTYTPTGNQLVEVLTKINGSRPTIKGYSAEDMQKNYEAQPLGTVQTTYKRKWQGGKWEYPSGVDVEYEGKNRDLEDVMRKYM